MISLFQPGIVCCWSSATQNATGTASEPGRGFQTFLLKMQSAEVTMSALSEAPRDFLSLAQALVEVSLTRVQHTFPRNHLPFQLLLSHIQALHTQVNLPGKYLFNNLLVKHSRFHLTNHLLFPLNTPLLKTLSPGCSHRYKSHQPPAPKSRITRCSPSQQPSNQNSHTIQRSTSCCGLIGY